MKSQKNIDTFKYLLVFLNEDVDTYKYTCRALLAFREKRGVFGLDQKGAIPGNKDGVITRSLYIYLWVYGDIKLR